MNTQTSILNDTSNAELTVDELGTLLAEKQFQDPGITPSGEQLEIASEAFRTVRNLRTAQSISLMSAEVLKSGTGLRNSYR